MEQRDELLPIVQCLMGLLVLLCCAPCMMVIVHLLEGVEVLQDGFGVDEIVGPLGGGDAHCGIGDVVGDAGGCFGLLYIWTSLKLGTCCVWVALVCVSGQDL